MLTLGNAQENLTLRSLTRIGVHEALVLVLRLFCINLAAPQQIEQARLHSTCTSFPFIVSIIKKIG